MLVPEKNFLMVITFFLFYRFLNLIVLRFRRKSFDSYRCMNLCSLPDNLLCSFPDIHCRNLLYMYPYNHNMLWYNYYHRFLHICFYNLVHKPLCSLCHKYHNSCSDNHNIHVGLLGNFVNNCYTRICAIYSKLKGTKKCIRAKW